MMNDGIHNDLWLQLARTCRTHRLTFTFLMLRQGFEGAFVGWWQDVWFTLVVQFEVRGKHILFVCIISGGLTVRTNDDNRIVRFVRTHNVAHIYGVI
jgi:hypothetical protein